MKLEELEQNMEKVVLSTNSMSYILEKVMGKFALLRVEAGIGITRGYEVHILRVFSPNDKYCPGQVRFASNSEFGKYGWYYQNKEQALAKLEVLHNGY